MIYQLILIFVGLGMDQFVDDEAEGSGVAYGP